MPGLVSVATVELTLRTSERVNRKNAEQEKILASPPEARQFALAVRTLRFWSRASRASRFWFCPLGLTRRSAPRALRLYTLGIAPCAQPFPPSGSAQRQSAALNRYESFCEASCAVAAPFFGTLLKAH